MDDIVCVGDVHEGIAFGYRMDPETGVSERALDLHRNFAKAAQHAIEQKASLFCVLGDLFYRPHIAPIYRERGRRDVAEPLGKAGIPVLLLAGNHDQPRADQKATSLDDFRGYPHVTVVKSPQVVVREIGGKRVGLLLLPYIHPEQLADMVREKMGEDVSRESWWELSRELLKKWIRQEAEALKVDALFLFGHFWVTRAQVHSHASEIVPHDLEFEIAWLPPKVDLAVFGHVHFHQVLDGRLVYTGAPERIDWGERGDPKGFVTLDVRTKGWRFVELPARPMHQVEVDVSQEADPTPPRRGEGRPRAPPHHRQRGPAPLDRREPHHRPARDRVPPRRLLEPPAARSRARRRGVPRRSAHAVRGVRGGELRDAPPPRGRRQRGRGDPEGGARLDVRGRRVGPRVPGEGRARAPGGLRPRGD